MGCLAVVLGLPAAASAQALYTGTPTANAGNVDPGDPGATLAAPSTARDPAFSVQSRSSTGLAFTGADIAELTVVGMGAIFTGSVLVRRGRRTA